jgi:hypothetical protein
MHQNVNHIDNPHSPQPHISPKLFLILGLLVLVVLTGVGSYVLGTKTAQPEVQPIVNTQVIQPTPALSPIVEIKSTERLITYKLPEGWTKETRPSNNPNYYDTIVIKSPDYRQIASYSWPGVIIEIENIENKDSDTYTKFYQAMYDEIHQPSPGGATDHDLTKVTLGKYKAVSFFRDFEGHSHTYRIWSEDNKYSIEVRIGSAQMLDMGKYKKEVDSLVNSITFVDQIQSTDTATPATGAGWKTYTNSVDNYSFKYPNNWTVKSENLSTDSVTKVTILQSSDFVSDQPDMGGGSIPGASKGKQLEISVSHNPNFNSYQEYKNFAEEKSTIIPKNFFSSHKEIMVGGVQAMVHLDGKPTYKGSLSESYFFNRKTIFTIVFTNSSSENDLFNQILSTFKFTQ